MNRTPWWLTVFINDRVCSPRVVDIPPCLQSRMPPSASFASQCIWTIVPFRAASSGHTQALGASEPPSEASVKISNSWASFGTLFSCFLSRRAVGLLRTGASAGRSHGGTDRGTRELHQ